MQAPQEREFSDNFRIFEPGRRLKFAMRDAEREVQAAAWHEPSFDLPILLLARRTPPPSPSSFFLACDAGQSDKQFADIGRRAPIALSFLCPCQSNWPMAAGLPTFPEVKYRTAAFCWRTRE